MKAKLLSVVIPCYNSQEFIEEAIESVLCQKFSDQLEIIIVDDGSTDKTNEICLKYNDYLNVNYFRIENHGAGYARNFGVNKASGIWVMFLDADDLMLVDINNYILDCLLQSKNKEILCFGKAQSNMRLTDTPYIKLPQQVNEIKNHIPVLEFWTCIYKVNFLKDNKILFFKYKEQDIETAFRYRVFSKSNAIDVFKIPLIIQRINLKSNTHTWNEYILFSVKAKVYYQLYIETNIVEDGNYLFNVVLTNILNYYKLLFIKGYNDDETIKDIKEVLKKIKNEKRVKGLKYIMAIFLDRLSSLVSTKIKPKSEKRSDDNVYYTNVTRTMYNLKQISEKILNSEDAL